VEEKPPTIKKIYTLDGAFAKLTEWGWNEVYADKPLTMRQLKQWSADRKIPVKKHPVTGRMIISEADLIRVYNGEL